MRGRVCQRGAIACRPSRRSRKRLPGSVACCEHPVGQTTLAGHYVDTYVRPAQRISIAVRRSVEMVALRALGPRAMDPSALYLEHLDRINRIAEALCTRHGVRGADAEDFTSEVRLRLLQDDYAVLRKYRGASSMPTFLTVVIGNLFRDYRIKRWGKWRPSAEAKRRGEAAVLLETAVYRDGRSFDDACRLLQSNGRVDVDAGELRRIMAELPRRIRVRQDDDASLDSVATTEETDDLV